MLQMWSLLTLTFLPEESANAWQFKTHTRGKKSDRLEARLYGQLVDQETTRREVWLAEAWLCVCGKSTEKEKLKLALVRFIDLSCLLLRILLVN